MNHGTIKDLFNHFNPAYPINAIYNIFDKFIDKYITLFDNINDDENKKLCFEQYKLLYQYVLQDYYNLYINFQSLMARHHNINVTNPDPPNNIIANSYKFLIQDLTGYDVSQDQIIYPDNSKILNLSLDNFIIFGDCHGDFFPLINLLFDSFKNKKYSKIFFLGDVFDPFNNEFIEEIKPGYRLENKVQFAFNNTIIFSYFIFYLIYRHNIQIYWILGNHDLSYSILYFYFFYMLIFSSIQINQQNISFYYNKKIIIGNTYEYNLSHPMKCFSDDYNTFIYEKIYKMLINGKANYKLYTINHYALQNKRNDNTINDPRQHNNYSNINYKLYKPKPNSGIDELDKPNKKLCGGIKHIYGHTNSMIFIIQKIANGIVRLVTDGIKIKGKKMSTSQFKLNIADMNMNYPLEEKNYGLDSTLSYYKSTSVSKKADMCLDRECFRNEVINNKRYFHSGDALLYDPENQIVGYIVFITLKGIQYQNLFKSYIIHDYIMYNSLFNNLIGGVKPSGHYKKEDDGKKNIKKSTNNLENPNNDIWKPDPRYNLRSTTKDPKTGKEISRIKLYENITKSSSYPFTKEKTQFLKKTKQQLKKINFYDIETMNGEEISDDEIMNDEEIFDAIYFTSKQDFFNVLSIMLLKDIIRKTKYSPFDIEFYEIEGNIINNLINFINLTKNQDQEFNKNILKNYYDYVDFHNKTDDLAERYITIKAFYSELTKIINHIQKNGKLQRIDGLNYEQQKIVIFFYNFIKELINDYTVEKNLLYRIFLYLMIYYYCYYFYLIIISNNSIKSLINIDNIIYIEKIFSISPEFVINLLYYCLYSYGKINHVQQEIFNIYSITFLEIIKNNETN